jgi:hypothetical protein
MARPDGTGTVTVRWTVPPGSISNDGVTLTLEMTITGIDIAWSAQIAGTGIDVQPADALGHHVRGIVAADGTVAPDTWTGSTTYTAKPIAGTSGGQTGSIDIQLRLGPVLHYNYSYAYQ